MSDSVQKQKINTYVELGVICITVKINTALMDDNIWTKN